MYPLLLTKGFWKVIKPNPTTNRSYERFLRQAQDKPFLIRGWVVERSEITLTVPIDSLPLFYTKIARTTVKLPVESEQTSECSQNI